jgi:hypothetical protein
MRIYIVDEMNKPILSDGSLTCNDKDYITTELTGGTYIDVDDSASGQYHISNIRLYKVDTDKLLPYSIPLYINTFTTKKSITITCQRIYFNDIDILTLFNNNQFKIGRIIHNRVIYNINANNAVSELIPVAFTTNVISATSLSSISRRIIAYDNNLNIVSLSLEQSTVSEVLFNDGSTGKVFITSTVIDDPSIKYVRIQIPLASNSLSIENLPNDDFLNQLGVKGIANEFTPVQNSIAFINRLRSAHNRKRG